MKTDAQYKHIGCTVLERFIVPSRLFIHRDTRALFSPLISVWCEDDETGEYLLFFEENDTVVERAMLVQQWREIDFTWPHVFAFDPRDRLPKATP